MNLLHIGISHKTAAIEIREKIALSMDEMRALYPELMERFAKEAVIVSTCNRTEFYLMPNENFSSEENFLEFLFGWKKISGLTKNNFYTFHGNNAAQHLMDVAAGVDSMIIGDVQILNQLRDSYELSVELGTAGSFMHEMFQAAFRVGKRVKAETSIGKGAVSISYAAVELGEKIFATLTNKKAMLIGAGETAELTAKHLVNHGIQKIFVANRTLERAQLLAENFSGSAITLEQIVPTIREVDIIISSVGGSEHILTAKQISSAMRDRPSKPLLIVDIGMPRNIDPAAAKIDNIFLEDIDSLEMIARANHEKRKSELPKVQEIIDQELGKFFEWAATLQVVPAIKLLREKCEEIRQTGLQKYRYKFAPEDFEKVEELTRAMMNRIMAMPISALRESSQSESKSEQAQILDAVRKIFSLDEEIHEKQELKK